LVQRLTSPRGLSALGVAALVVAAAMTWLVVVYPASREGTGRVIEVELRDGTSLPELAARLQRDGAIAHGWAWVWYARLLGAGDRLRRGTVLLSDGMSAREVLQRLAEGFGAAPIKVTIPEGYTRYDVGALFQRWGLCTKAELIAATENPKMLKALSIPGPNAEGYLFPDTYLLVDDYDAGSLLKQLVSNYRRRTDQLFEDSVQQMAALQRELGWGRQQVLTLASIVEREAAKRDEMPVIAGVFLNRLRDPNFKPQRLQADPTVSYGCLVQPWLPACLAFDGRRVTRAMTSDAANRYNTYRLEGLPPGPISNPGLDAIKAVIKPAQHRYFYFVAKGGGRHAFSETLDGHNAAVAKARQ